MITSESERMYRKRSRKVRLYCRIFGFDSKIRYTYYYLGVRTTPGKSVEGEVINLLVVVGIMGILNLLVS